MGRNEETFSEKSKILCTKLFPLYNCITLINDKFLALNLQPLNYEGNEKYEFYDDDAIHPTCTRLGLSRALSVPSLSAQIR